MKLVVISFIRMMIKKFSGILDIRDVLWLCVLNFVVIYSFVVLVLKYFIF